MSEVYEIFEVWTRSHASEIESGDEVTVPLKDLESFSKINVVAQLGAKEFPGSSTLRVVNDMGEKTGQLFIKVIKEVEED
jgi:hypothetical protein